MVQNLNQLFILITFSASRRDQFYIIFTKNRYFKKQRTGAAITVPVLGVRSGSQSDFVKL